MPPRIKPPDNSRKLAALEAQKRGLELAREMLTDSLIPPTSGTVFRRRALAELDAAGLVPDDFWDKDAAFSDRISSLVGEIYDLRKASGLDPRTGLPKPKRTKPPPTIGEEGYYPGLLGETSELFQGCDQPKLVARERTADGRMEHLECPRRHHHLRYVLDDGTVTAGLSLSSYGKRAVIDMVYTDPSYRRHGYAAKLLAFARERYTVKHSKTLTDNGKAWARAVNPLHKARSAWDSWTKEDRETERRAWKKL